MDNIKNTSKEALLAELARREALQTAGPAMKEVIDWSPLLKLLRDLKEYETSDDYCEDNDYDYYIYEAAIQCAYGDGYFPWANSLH